MKIYKGHVTSGQMDWSVDVLRGEVRDEMVSTPLNPRHDLMNSPDGFSWGYNGSGPAQLALAMLADFLQDDQQALALYQDFKDEFIVKLDSETCWERGPLSIQVALNTIELKALGSFVVRMQNKLTNGVANEDTDTDDILRLEEDAAILMRRFKIAGDIYDYNGELVETIVSE